MSSSSQDLKTTEVQTRYSHGDGSSQTLRFSISTKKSLSDDDAETVLVALRLLQHETINLVEFLKIRPGCMQYYFEYSSEDYVKAYGRGEGLKAEFGIALEITWGCATKMRIRTTDNDVTIPLHFEQAIDPLDAKAIRAYMITALTHGTSPVTAANQAGLLLALSRFGRKDHPPDQRLSLSMLADQEQQEAADAWLKRFRDAPDTASTYRDKLVCGTACARRMGAIVFHGLWRGLAVLIAPHQSAIARQQPASRLKPTPMVAHDRQLVHVLANMVLAAEAGGSHVY